MYIYICIHITAVLTFLSGVSLTSSLLKFILRMSWYGNLIIYGVRFYSSLGMSGCSYMQFMVRSFLLLPFRDLFHCYSIRTRAFTAITRKKIWRSRCILSTPHQRIYIPESTGPNVHICVYMITQTIVTLKKKYILWTLPTAFSLHIDWKYRASGCP